MKAGLPNFRYFYKFAKIMLKWFGYVTGMVYFYIVLESKLYFAKKNYQTLKWFLNMKNRLPLPLSTIKIIQELIGRNQDLGMVNQLKNTVKLITSYDYIDAIRVLGFLKEDYPYLMDYEKEVYKIQEAYKRYNKL